MTPIDRRSMFCVASPVALIVELVTIGISWPMFTRAVWLSNVITCGRLSTSIRPWTFRARTRMLNVSLAAENTSPPTPFVGEVRPTPRLPRPWNPTVPWLPTVLIVGSGWLTLLKFVPIALA
jgi:hypothetical protein